jgi:hypothetical protein
VSKKSTSDTNRNEKDGSDLRKLLREVGAKGGGWSFSEVSRRIGRDNPNFLYNALNPGKWLPPTTPDMVKLALLWSGRKGLTGPKETEALKKWLTAGKRPFTEEELPSLIEKARQELAKVARERESERATTAPVLTEVIKVVGIHDSEFPALLKACAACQDAASRREQAWMTYHAGMGGRLYHFHEWTVDSGLVFQSADMKDWYKRLSKDLEVSLFILDGSSAKASHEKLVGEHVPSQVKVRFASDATKFTHCEPVGDVMCFWSGRDKTISGQTVSSPARLLEVLKRRASQLPGLDRHYVRFVALPVPVEEEALKTLLGNRNFECPDKAPPRFLDAWKDPEMAKKA